MPPPQTCPNCRRDGVWLEHASVPAFVNYYRCQSGHVWCLPKNDPKGPIWFVTEVPARPTARQMID